MRVLLVAWAAVTFWAPASAVDIADEGPILRVPAALDCSEHPEWNAFRQQAVAHVEAGWPIDGADAPALEASAAALHKRWSPLICAEPCTSSDDLRYGFVQALGEVCHDSVQFERYLVVHYFTNRGLEYGNSAAKAAAQGFCFYGYVTALAVLAQFEFQRSVARAKRLLFLALTLLGDFFAFDWIESSSWPASLMDINLHLKMVTNAWIPAPKHFREELSSHPGETGPGPLQGLQRWEGTCEAAKPASGILREVVVWQVCQHTTVAGEAKTMLTRFQDAIGVRVRFVGNSLARNVCRNYGLCAAESLAKEIRHHFDSYGRRDRSFTEAARGFVGALRRHVASADVLLCTQPPAWCRFLLAFGDKAVWMHAGLPLLWDVQDVDHEAWLRDFVAMAHSPRHIVTASSVFMAKELEWQAGVRPPVLRLLGLHTNAVHAPVRSNEVLVSRFGTSGALSECVFDLFLQANPWYPLRFIQLEQVLLREHQAAVRAAGGGSGGDRRWEEHISEVKTPGMPYQLLAEHLAVVVFPYDAVIFLFHEFYAMQMPVFVPRDLWRWLFGPLTHPSMEIQAPLENRSAAPGHEPPPHSPFFAEPRRPLDIEQAAHWSGYTDWGLLPHVHYFRSVPELFTALLDGQALRVTSARMKSFNEDQLVSLVGSWRHVAHRLAHTASTATGAR